MCVQDAHTDLSKSRARLPKLEPGPTCWPAEPGNAQLQTQTQMPENFSFLYNINQNTRTFVTQVYLRWCWCV